MKILWKSKPKKPREWVYKVSMAHKLSQVFYDHVQPSRAKSSVTLSC